MRNEFDLKFNDMKAKLDTWLNQLDSWKTISNTFDSAYGLLSRLAIEKENLMSSMFNGSLRFMKSQTAADYQNGRLMFGSFDSINFNNSFQIDLTYLVNESGLNENKNWAIT